MHGVRDQIPESGGRPKLRNLSELQSNVPTPRDIFPPVVGLLDTKDLNLSHAPFLSSGDNQILHLLLSLCLLLFLVHVLVWHVLVLNGLFKSNTANFYLAVPDKAA